MRLFKPVAPSNNLARRVTGAKLSRLYERMFVLVEQTVVVDIRYDTTDRPQGKTPAGSAGVS
jgi:hypothetical protein